MASAPNPRARPRRPRVTRPSVRVAEALARALITTGGICTIVAVGTISVFLAWVVVPLFGSASAGAPRAFGDPGDPARPAILHCGVDEYRQLAWTLDADAVLVVVHLGTGARLQRRDLRESWGGARPTCSSFDGDSASVALGFESGDVRFVHLGFAARYLEAAELDDALRALQIGGQAVHGAGVVERTPEGQWRLQELALAVDEPVRVSSSEPASAVTHVDHGQLANGELLCTLTAAGELALRTVRRTTNLLTGEDTLIASGGDLPYRPAPGATSPRFVRALGGGDAVLLAWGDGRCVRFDTRDLDRAVEAEVFDLVDDPAAELTALEFLIGKRTLVAGDSRGRASGWFRIKPGDATTIDGALFVRAKELPAGHGAVARIAASESSRALAVAYEGGEIALFFMTNERELARAHVPDASPVVALALAPRNDALVAWTRAGAVRWDVDAPHPESNVAALFGPMWYENLEGPEHVWQSSSGTDDFEAKLGLVPLVFGTLKATFYSMLFGVPLALLAAIYSSEFLGPRLRVGVKSVVEVMASLPSVVLGFLAAIVIAPFVQGVVPTVLTGLFALPFAMLAGAHLWQLVPQRIALRLEGWQRFALIGTSVPAGLGLAVLLGPRVERWLFAGDIAAWLDGQRGGAVGGWLILFLPLSAFAVVFALGRWIDPWVRSVSLRWSRARCARFALLKFALASAATVALALAVSGLCSGLGFDARGEYLDTYVQGNALVAGFLMGFAIIPIIYTLAEDALSSVPSELRLASLGAGATPWQTAVRVIVPTAMSGLFSAVMIGLGRAVGETMIVLMAAGNTPVLEWNVFSGFRTLSANIAVELPEAVRNDTHYRTLFLAALVLFAITFAINTLAEVVRQRFRKRAYQL